MHPQHATHNLQSFSKSKKKRRNDESDDDIFNDESEASFSESDSDTSEDSLHSDLNDELLEEVDERELAGLTELEREALLSERAEKRQQILEKLEVRKRLKAGRKESKRLWGIVRRLIAHQGPPPTSNPKTRKNWKNLKRNGSGSRRRMPLPTAMIWCAFVL